MAMAMAMAIADVAVGPQRLVHEWYWTFVGLARHRRPRYKQECTLGQSISSFWERILDFPQIVRHDWYREGLHNNKEVF